MNRLIVLLLSLLCCLSVHADERILSFHSDIDIAADATMIVSETIKVRSEGDRIRRGIYRDFPTHYRDRYGNRIDVLFEPVDVTRDGAPEASHSEGLSNGMRVYFGDANVLLDDGEHTYVFRYRTSRQLGFFEDHDELYWNVTGNGWAFTIDQASAVVSLPGNPDAAQIKVEGYTGAQGSKGQDYTASVDENGHAHIATTRQLPPENGLTVVVSFPKGLVAAPDMNQKMAWFAADNRREAVLGIGLIVVLGFLYMQWKRVGVDPKGGVVIPEYDPPPGISPAAARYIRRMEYDDRCFAADMVDLGVCGAVKIIKQGKSDFSIERAGTPGENVPDSARVLYESLLGTATSLEFKNENHTEIGAARSGHESFLKSTFAKDNFNRNDGIGCLGALISIAAIVGAFLIDRQSANAAVIVPTVLTFFAATAASTLIYKMIVAWQGGRRPIGLSIGALVAAAAVVVVAGFLTMTSSLVFAILVALIAGVQVPFGYWMRAPTVQGRKLLDRIEGLRLYLAVAEADDLGRAKAPPMNLDEYQRLLPYALALDVEKTWGDKLADAIGPAAVAAAAAGMAWYYGGNGRAFDASSFGSSLGSSLSSAISSSATAPGSSSGGGGGGSSGGGGGGGGGGGW
ncbi:MAG: DUF2207 domain-containing protein [Xanthomonadales bacterium]|nr:DUF2207 domain-containing protein [Xanthomonadales bacterium]